MKDQNIKFKMEDVRVVCSAANPKLERCKFLAVSLMFLVPALLAAIIL